MKLAMRIELLAILALFICDAECQKNAARSARFWRTINLGSTVDCFEAHKECRRTKECRTALRQMDRKCKIESGRCSPSTDLQECGRIMDTLFSHSFPENRCRCERSLMRCFPLLNKIYANSCFVEVRKLPERQKEDTFFNYAPDTPPAEPISEAHSPNFKKENRTSSTTQPTEETASVTNEGEIKGKLTTPTSVVAYGAFAREMALTRPFSTISRSHRVVEEPIFGDEGFAKSPPSRRIVPMPKSHKPESGRKDHGDINQGQRDTKYTKTEKEGALMPTERTKEQLSTTFNDSQENTSEGSDQFKSLRDILKGSEAHSRTDKYSIVSIALGSLLCLCVVAAIFYFSWRRLRKSSLLYTRGKPVQNNLDEVKTHNNMQPTPTGN